MTNGQNTDFKDAKAAVLSYCSSAQTGAGALLIGYSVALFTLFTLFKDLESTGLGYLFNFGKPDWINWLVENDYIKFGLLLVGAVLITTLIVRTIHRYAAYSGISNYVMYSETCSREKEKSLEYSILHNAFNVMQKRRAILLPLGWFVTGELDGTNQKNNWWIFWGWFFSCLIGIALVVGLIIMLW